jgi:S1-C subfamily serine protease
MKLRLHITVSAGSAFSWEQDRPDVYIGRDPDAELHLQGDNVQNISWRHARIELTPEGAYLTDLESTNGTFLNGQRITRRSPVRVGDQVQLGRTGPSLQVVEVELPEPSPAPCPAVSTAGSEEPLSVVVLAPPSPTRLMLRVVQARQQWLMYAVAVAAAGVLVLGVVLGLVIYWPRSGAPSGHYTAERLASKYRERVYFIQVHTKGGTSLGSGILVANSKTRGLIATNLHVVDIELEKNALQKKLMPDGPWRPMAIEVKNPGQLTPKPARWAAFHRHFDIALLVIELENASPGAVTIIRQGALRDGEEAVVMGYPLGIQLSTSTGVISNPRGDEDGFIYTTCASTSGNSGGPLFVQRRGLLAGLHTLTKLKPMPGGSVAEVGNLKGAMPGEEIVSTLQTGRTENWVWAPDLKLVVVELARMVPLKE